MIQRIGRYEITGKLGDGGFGTVYRGYDPDVKRVVAIKVLATQGDASLIHRFRSEAMTAGNLNHKNIVTIYEFGEENGVPFIAMQHLDGVDLQRIIDNKRQLESLTLLEKLEIMSETAQGLQCAHENGVVHRDIKPANIMRLKDGSVKIMDFGIARLTNTDATRETQTGFLIGTVKYMAPEQFKSPEVGALCDIWSYGVVCYELLTGVHPFSAEGPAGVIYRITMEEPQPVGSLVPDCPPALAANIHRLLSKDSRTRTQSLEDFLMDAEPVIAGLTKTEIPALLKQAERLIAEDNIDEAQPVVGRILRLDRSNPEARRLRERLRGRVHLQTLRPKIEALVREADERAGSRDFTSALEKLNSAMLLDPDSPTLRSRLERIRGEEERVRRADEAVSRGRRSIEEGDLTGAFKHFSEALETDPGHRQCPALMEEVRKAMRARELHAQVRAVMAEADSLILLQAYDDAITLLAGLIEKTGSDEAVAGRLLEARRLKHEQEIKDRLNAGIAASRDLLKQGNYEQACRALEALDRENPGNASIAALLKHARDRLRAVKLANEIESLLAQARGHRNTGRFDDALRCARQALELDPGNTHAMALQRSYLDEAQADRDRVRIDAALQQYQALLKDEKLEEASALVDRLAAEHPGVPRVADAKAAVADRIRKREEAQLKIREGIEEAERLLAATRVDSATKLLDDLTVQYPAEAALNDLLAYARELKDSREAQDRLNAGLLSVRQLLTSGDVGQACRALEDLDRQYPKNTAVEALLEQARERMKTEKASARLPVSRSKAMIVAACVLIAAALAFPVYHYLGRTAKTTPDVRPAPLPDSRTPPRTPNVAPRVIPVPPDVRPLLPPPTVETRKENPITPPLPAVAPQVKPERVIAATPDSVRSAAPPANVKSSRAVTPPAPPSTGPGCIQDYSGPISGEITWQGVLDKPGIISISGAEVSVGSIKGKLFRVPIEITSVDPDDVVVVQEPSSANACAPLILRPSAGKAGSVRIKWRVR
jgi:serine/threonine-protein kinase